MVKRILLFLFTAPFLSLAIFLFLKPIHLAILYPTWLGYEDAGNNVFIDRQAADPKRTEIIKNIAEARKTLTSVFGPLQANPKILATTSEELHHFFGGGKALGNTYGTIAIEIRPAGQNVEIITHELAHAEMHHRIGVLSSYRRLPAWFNEGLAVLLSKDKRYIGEPGPQDVAENEVMKITSPTEWSRRAEKEKIYAPAYRVVKKWHEKAGHKGILELIERLKKGEQFSVIFTELGDRP